LLSQDSGLGAHCVEVHLRVSEAEECGIHLAHAVLAERRAAVVADMDCIDVRTSQEMAL